MIYEYALDPELVVQWCDRKKYIFFDEKFGVRSRRVPSAYPKKEWRKLIWEAFIKSPYSEDQNAQTKITELVQNLWQNSIKRPSTFSEIKDWLERAEKEHEERPFHAILATTNPRNQECVIEVKKLMETGHSSWAIPDINSTLRNPEEIASAVAPIFKICRHALLIDPYFDPTKDRFCQTLEAFLNRCNHNVCGIDCFILEMHTSIDRFFENWEKHKNRDPIREQNVYENFIADCKKRLPNYIPENTQIKIIVWKEKENGEKLHNRYLLTDRFGVMFGTGSDSADNPGSKESDDIVLLDEGQYQNRYKQYSNSAPAFDMVGKPFIISSPA